ncbi:MAG: aromatic-ring-hydroxylating dioxygenase subunit beta [Gammaproteobacteria bacterium]|nr:aromatic-ring-hydroxylating dioxygenase subunit beta [Gammaproteobacteria bacterium]
MSSGYAGSLHDEIRQLIARETACLNSGDLDGWMSLFTDDGYYWMPLEEEQTSPDAHDSLIYDNKALMEIRRNNLGHPLSPSMDEPVRSVRILSELEIDADAGATEYQARGVVIAVIYHRRQDTFAGRVTYTLRREGTHGALRIQCKRVDLLNRDAPLDPIMIYV